MQALVVTVPAPEAELAADALWALGVAAIEERDPSAGLADHFVELWTSLGDDTDSITTAAGGFPARWQWRLVTVADDVADTWRAHAVPSWVADDLVVCPAWVPLDVPPATIIVRIEPGATFGLGNHPSTVLAMRAMRTSLFPGAIVLDVGCGSGVQAVTACLLGAIRADAIDINPAAGATTRDNAQRNGVDAAITASATPIEQLDGTYDVIVANLLAPVIIDIAADLRRLLGPSGVLVISGVLAERADHVVAALAPLHVIARSSIEGWEAITLRW